MVVVGPCSIHDPEVAYEYASRLVKVARPTKNRLCIVMRAYFEKPRTVVGWKGLLSDPRLDGSSDMPSGLAIARDVLRHIGELGLPCGTEFLDPVVPQYVGDLITWAAIGARTTESQTHRTMASGSRCRSASRTAPTARSKMHERHDFRAPWARVPGHQCRRGNLCRQDDRQPRWTVVRFAGRRGAKQLPPQRHSIAAEWSSPKSELVRGVIVDCSHDNSGKDHTKQAGVVREIAATFRTDNGPSPVSMIESNLSRGSKRGRRGVGCRMASRSPTRASGGKRPKTYWASCPNRSRSERADSTVDAGLPFRPPCVAVGNAAPFQYLAAHAAPYPKWEPQ